MQRRRLLWSAERGDGEREELSPLAWLFNIECGGEEWCRTFVVSFLLICIHLTYEVRLGPSREFMCMAESHAAIR